MSGFIAEIALEHEGAREWIRRASTLIVEVLRGVGVNVDAAEFMRDPGDAKPGDGWPSEVWRWTVRHPASGAEICWEVTSEDEGTQLQVTTNYNSPSGSSPPTYLHMFGPYSRGRKRRTEDWVFADGGWFYVDELVDRRLAVSFDQLPPHMRSHYTACCLASPRMVDVVEFHRDCRARGGGSEYGLGACSEDAVKEAVRDIARVFLKLIELAPDATT